MYLFLLATNNINIMRVFKSIKEQGRLVNYKWLWGHSSLAVSLTYLRGLEVSDLEESDMPVM